MWEALPSVAREIELLVVQRAKLAHPDDMTMPVAPSSSGLCSRFPASAAS